ncbi:MAG: Bug family tripartite tricarboxylate transporter substrate binding protein [Pseudomonadota bacterium]
MRTPTLAVLLAVSFPVPGEAADPFPLKPVRIITASPATTGDLLARQLAQQLAERWGQPVIVENRAGGAGVLAAEIAARASPDGYTVHLGQLGSFGAAPSLLRSLSYDPLRSFAPITRFAQVSQLVISHPSVPATSLKELIAHAKNPASRMSYGSGGVGTSGHLTLELFKSTAGVDILHVPFRGVGAALTGVVTGEVQLAVLPAPVALPQARAGKVRAYAVTSDRRFASAPDIPTAAQAGLPALESTTWFAMFAPAKTPAAIVDRLNRDMVAIIGSSAMATWLAAQGAEATPSTPQELAMFVAAEIAKWARVVKAAGITPE